MQTRQRKGRAVFLLILLFSFLLLQIGMFIDAIRLILSDSSSVMPSSWLQLGLGLAWAVLFGSGIIKLWQRSHVWEIRSLKLLAVFFTFSGLRFALFARSDYDRQRIPFVLFITFLVVMITVIAIWYRGYSRSHGDIE
jgi:hypothetical protein